MDKPGNAQVPVKYEYKRSDSATLLTLVQFSAEKEEKKIRLTWLASHVNQKDPFEIEHSVNGKDWENIGSENVNEGNHPVIEFSFAHESPAVGSNSYRIKMIGAEGTFVYSAVKNVDFEKPSQTVIGPCGQADVVHVQVENADDISKLRALNIYDTKGNLVLSPELTQGRIDVDALKNGFYVVQILKKNGQIPCFK